MKSNEFELEMIPKNEAVHVPSIVPLFTYVIRSCLRIGVPMGPVGLLTAKGRLTGKSRRNPVRWFKHDGPSYLIYTFGTVSWVRTLPAARQSAMRKGFHKTQ